ncbi:hypothetical protein K3495_g15233 [Podosphaera aphanis]|nr:hypothetical protein K3495_g15233 [Podosphaera aphanis]
MKGSPQSLSLPPLRFMSINVGRGSAAHDIALSRACDLQLDFLLVQEPWWAGCTKSHPYFNRHIPYGGVGTRPRAVTYSRKDDRNIHAVQESPSSKLTGDYCWVKVNGITFFNVYKAPHDPAAVEPLLEWTPPPRTIAAGDFNSVYWAWQPSATSNYGQGEEIEKWADENGLSCLILGEPTHRAGNTLDLAWTNISGASA